MAQGRRHIFLGVSGKRGDRMTTAKGHVPKSPRPKGMHRGSTTKGHVSHRGKLSKQATAKGHVPKPPRPGAGSRSTTKGHVSYYVRVGANLEKDHCEGQRACTDAGVQPKGMYYTGPGEPPLILNQAVHHTSMGLDMTSSPPSNLPSTTRSARASRWRERPGSVYQ